MEKRDRQKTDLPTLLKMRRATKIYHQYARPSDRAGNFTGSNASAAIRLGFQRRFNAPEFIGNLSGTEPTFARGEKCIGDVGSWRGIND
jgi:hypothetical protein